MSVSSSTITCAMDLIAESGFFTSWATVAAICPSAASRSPSATFLSSRTFSSIKRKSSIAMATCPASTSNTARTSEVSAFGEPSISIRPRFRSSRRRAYPILYPCALRSRSSAYIAAPAVWDFARSIVSPLSSLLLNGRSSSSFDWIRIRTRLSDNAWAVWDSMKLSSSGSLRNCPTCEPTWATTSR